MIRLENGLARSVFVLLLLSFSVVTLQADVTLPSLLSIHAVLQKTAKTRIWGKADPQEVVHVTLGEVKAQATAGADGKWQAELDLTKSGPGPFDLIVEGKNKITVPDVVVGEVWLCAGQSNMQFSLRGDIHAPDELKLTNPMLRQFQVTIASSLEPKDDCEGVWVTETPDTVAGFTAVGYYFGKKLQTELGVPVGLINTAVGGTAIEVWMSNEAFAKLPYMDADKQVRLQKNKEYPDKLQAYIAAYQEWATKNGREDKPLDPAPFAAPEVSTAGWPTVMLPGKIASATVPASGAVWVRSPVTVPAALAPGKPGTITMTAVHDFITFYWNGVKFAETTPSQPAPYGIYKFNIPGEDIKEGENTLAMRIFCASDQMGMDVGNPAHIAIGLTGAGQPIYLDGPLPAKVESTLPPISAEALAAMPKAPFPPSMSSPTGNYNAMIAPLLPATLRGIIWYQGEANVPRGFEYRNSFPVFIQDYRERFGTDLSFYFCQLPNYQPRATEQGLGEWPELRESQSTALALPKTGEAVLIDIGEETNLHPRNKKDAGERLAAIALAKDYGKSVVYSGPVYDSMKIEGNQVSVKFRNIDGGLVSKPLPAEYRPNSVQKDTKPLIRHSPQSEVEGFAICGEDHQWTWADAKISGDSVVVSAASVPKPVAVRYAWEDNPIFSLYNGAGFPAAPFRTDDFALKTQDAKY